MKTKFTSSVIILFTLISSYAIAQSWVEKMQDPNANFYQIKADFEQYWSTHNKDEKGKGYKVFKRWENFVERRVYPSGDLSLLNLTAINYKAFLQQQSSQTTGAGKVIGSGNLIASTTWTAMGPFGPLSGSAGSQLLKSGRLGFITIDPNNSNNLWVGAPAGGLWKSTNGGTSWTTNTDNLAVLGCSDLAIDPTNTLVMYLATGDGDAGDTRSIGVLKTVDGGVTWATTGLTNTVNNYFLIRRLLVNPSNTQIVLAATNSGVYRTANGGSTWTQVSTANCYDLEFKPGDPNTVYAGGTSLRISTNGGTSFTQVTSGITTAAGRMAIAVTPADVNYVYVLATNSSSGFLGLYRSTNSGTTFSVMSTTPNILDGTTTGSGTGGQGWYDLCIAASPLNKDEIVTGGVNVWRSIDGGINWSLYGHWTGSGGAPFTHADQHDLEYDAAGTLFNTNDGTVYKRTGTTWTEISGSMNISQIYKIGLSSVTANKWITGHQDNGTSIWNGSSYSAKLGGDGMDCFYDRTNDNNVFGEYQNGAMQRSTNGGTSWSSATSGMTGTPPWVTIWKQDPQVSTTLYAGYTDLFKSTNLGASWTSLTALPGSGTVREFAIATNSNQVIYVLKSSGIYKTTDGGTTWLNVTGTVPVASASPEFISIDPNDANNAWVVLSGYSAGNKVFMTTNGGTSWTNVSSNLPNIPANCCVYEPGSNDRIYVGMDVGIYYKDNLSTNWTLYNTGLPNAPISDLEISPASPTLLHAATFGRGVWVTNVVSAAYPPTSNFSFPSVTKCAGTSITFTDQSQGAATAWSWSVNPVSAAISSGTVQNPSITFPSGGTYTVSLQASNNNGSGTTVSQVVSIVGSPTVIVANSSQTLCGGGTATFTASGANTYSWSNGGGSASTATYAPLSTTVYTVTGTSNGCSGKKTVTVTTAPGSTIGILGPNAICMGGSVTLLGFGPAVSYTWNTNANSSSIVVSPTATTVYSLTATTVNNCKPSATATISVNPLPTVSITASDSVICANQQVILNVFGAVAYTWSPGGQNGNAVVFNPSTTSTFVCMGTDINGCSDTSSFTVRVSACTGIKALTLNQSLYSVYPNPTKGKLIISSAAVTQNSQVELEVMDVSGKTVFHQTLLFTGTEKDHEVNLTHLSSGSYFVKLRSKEVYSEAIRIIKE